MTGAMFIIDGNARGNGWIRYLNDRDGLRPLFRMIYGHFEICTERFVSLRDWLSRGQGVFRISCVLSIRIVWTGPCKAWIQDQSPFGLRQIIQALSLPRESQYGLNTPNPIYQSARGYQVYLNDFQLVDYEFPM